MRVVWKYRLDTDNVVLNLPAGAEVLHVGGQRGALCLWVLVDPAGPTTQRRFMVWGTGCVMPDGDWRHVGSVLSPPDGEYVFHVFEVAS